MQDSAEYEVHTVQVAGWAAAVADSEDFHGPLYTGTMAREYIADARRARQTAESYYGGQVDDVTVVHALQLH